MDATEIIVEATVNATYKRCGSCKHIAGKTGELKCTLKDITVKRTQKACIMHKDKPSKRLGTYARRDEDEWNPNQINMLVKLNSLGRSLLFISQQVGRGCDECLTKLEKMGIERKKVSPTNYAAEIAEKQKREALARKKIEAEQEERRQRDLAAEMKKRQREERMKQYQEWPKDQRTASYSQKPCSGKCCLRKDICQHYQSWLEHGSLGYKGLVIQSVDNCINYIRDGSCCSYFHFLPMNGHTKDDTPVYADII